MYIPLTDSKVQGRLAAPELTALLNAAKLLEQTPAQLLADAIAVVTLEVRGFVSGCKENTLGPLGTIPDELEGAALALIRRYLFTRLPRMESLYGPVRQQETKDALDLLARVSNCKFGIVPPEVPAVEQAAGPGVQLVTSRERIATRRQTAGL